jgi:maltose/moltooligosaccharide transporter
MTNWFSISNTAPEGMIPDSVKFSFYAGGVIFFLAVMWTIYRTKEYSPEELKAFEEYEKQKHGIDQKIERPDLPPEEMAKPKMVWGPALFLIGLFLTGIVYSFDMFQEEMYILSVGIALIGVVFVISAKMQQAGSKGGMVVIFDDLFLMPKTMKQLAVVQFFSWFALFAMWIYTTSAVTSHIYDMHLTEVEVAELEQAIPLLDRQTDADWHPRLSRVSSDLQTFREQLDAGQSNVTASMRVVTFFLEEGRVELTDGVRSALQRVEREYNEGADWVGVAFAIYNGFAALVAFLLPVLARVTNRRITHAISLIAGAVGLISIYFISDPMLILVSMVGVGLAWASILSMPYAILAGSLPAAKMGIYMGIFNFFIVLPQILAATILGFLVGSVFGGQPVFALILGGVTWIAAAGLTLLVDDVDDPDQLETAAAA